MEIDLIPTLIEQFQETFEGETRPGWVWIVDGPPDSAVFGTIESLTADEAFASPVEGARSIASHVAHLRFALDLTRERLEGKNPPADWQSSFEVADTSPASWELLKQDLRRAYESVLTFLQSHAERPVTDWPPMNVVGLAAMTAHNAYHLGAIRQIARVVRK